jgi:hypothetical protein
MQEAEERLREWHRLRSELEAAQRALAGTAAHDDDRMRAAPARVELLQRDTLIALDALITAFARRANQQRPRRPGTPG